MAKPTNAELEGDIITGARSPWDKRHNAAMQELIGARERLARLEAALGDFLDETDCIDSSRPALSALVDEWRTKFREALSPSEAGGGGK